MIEQKRGWYGEKSLSQLLTACYGQAVIAVIASYWFGDITLGIIIAVAIVINLITAGITGCVAPTNPRPIRHRPCASRWCGPHHYH
jgi:magnesium transporter